MPEHRCGAVPCFALAGGKVRPVMGPMQLSSDEIKPKALGHL